MFRIFKNYESKNKHLLALFVLTVIITLMISSVNGANVTVSGNSFTDVENSFNSGDIVNLGSNTYFSDGNRIDVDVNNVAFIGNKNNHAVFDGRGNGVTIFDVSGRNVTFKYIDFKNVKSHSSGGCIKATNTIYVDNCLFKDNEAESGSAIGLFEDGENSVIENSIFINNHGVNPGSDNYIEGGAIDTHVTNISIRNCSFENNFALNRGGAISLAFGTDQVIDCIFKNNSAPSAGAIYSRNSTATIINCTFEDNNVTLDGGAVFSRASNLSITNSKFISNIAGDTGGAIYHDPVDFIVSFNISGSTFKDNNADTGGAIYSFGSTIIDNSDFLNNCAIRSAGAIRTGEDLKLARSTFSGNIAGNSGGTLYLDCVKNFRVNK
ncbi:hypothetical protein [Methanobrevibacter filiformis]|uniref:Right handed beta helix domain-containing protein n=1 Tax=Methanobrevibacter filiformis TaxID=55758 RepID=A0A166CIK2_9EURY|nr:hypothetical protein [Methanobrevibacter filiformis]KZX14667.1 hypothetical protein MBFIL_08200 [Methanobrevibacter filiformis]